MSDGQLLAFIRNGCRTKGKGKGKGKEKTKFGGGFSRAAGPSGIPPRDRADIRCINCAGSGHGWRSCPHPEVPRDQRKCLKCHKPGHISADCKNAALSTEVGKVQQPGTEAPPKPSWAMKIMSDKVSVEPRVRGRPFTRAVDDEGYEIVTGRF